MKLDISPDAAELRRCAELRLREQRPETRGGQTETDSRRLLHELEVHQIELGMQNAMLQESGDRLEAMLEKYTDLYDFAPVGYLTLDGEGTIREANLTAAGLLGIERSKLVNRRLGLFVATEKRVAFSTFLKHALGSVTAIVCETELQPEGNPPCWVWLKACGSVSGQECRMAVLDITGRKRAEAVLVRLERQVQAASEREQQRIGEQLRADLCQRLIAIEAATATLAATLKAKARPESGLAGEIAAEVNESLQQARRFADLLQPVFLLKQGLVAAVGHLALQVQESSGIPTHFKAEDLPPIAAADATHLYRIAQEALGNAVEHAKASQIDLGLSRSKRAVTLTIVDDGSGMVESPEQGTSLGLQIMRYRSDVIGAALTIASRPGRGTIVTCCYPVAGEELCPVISDQ